jgi:hypothetical protein
MLFDQVFVENRSQDTPVSILEILSSSTDHSLIGNSLRGGKTWPPS